ncbi:MAG: ATP-binding protein [Mariprofundaceae bacterium]|nr:ATP-binding protein [Mariprofundaceae bacterium]
MPIQMAEKVVKLPIEKLTFVGRLYLLLAMAALPVFVIFMLSVWWNESYSLEKMLARYGHSLVGGFAESARLGLQLEDTRLARDAVAGVRAMDDVLQLDIYDAAGQRMVSMKRSGPPMAFEHLRRLSGDAPLNITQGHEERFIAAIRGDGKDIAGYVVMDLSRHRVRMALDGALIVAFAVCLLLFLVFWMLIWHGFRRLSQPLFEMDAAVAGVTEGDLSVSINSHVSEPFGRMARGFNRMVRTLRQNQQENSRKTRELAESERHFRELFLHMPVAMYVADLQGKLRECNPAMAAMCGYTDYKQMMTSVECDARLYADAAERSAWMNEVLQNGRVAGRETQLVSSAGGVLHCLMHVTLVRGQAKEPVAVEVMLQDVTELRLLEQSLIQAQKMEAVGQLAGGVAHDFNNLLTMIQGHAEMLDEQIAHNSEAGQHVEQIVRAADRATELTANLLGFARKGEMRRETVVLHKILQEVTSLLSETGSRRVRITLQGDEMCKVIGDPGQLHQVFMNLGINALHAMPEGGDLIFALLHHGEHVCVRVSDTGVGIAQDVLQHVFEPFFTTRDTGEGTGLGLSMVHGIVERQGGEIRVESALGKGTVFELLLPVAQVSVEQKSSVPISKTTGAESVVENISGTVLLVDDEPDLLDIAGKFLDRAGLQTMQTVSGEAALECLDNMADSLPDMVLLDMNMPGIGGVETLRRIRKRYPDMVVVIQSGYSETTLSLDTPNLYYDGYVSKPYRRKSLCDEVLRVLSAKRRD